MELKRDLSLFDLTNIVVGAIVGSDIYIASAITAGLIGPFSIIIWLVAGAFATVLAMIFAYSAYYVPKVGGSFAFVSTAFDDFYGFIAGWSMWIAEVLSLPVFAITFTNYLQYFIPLNFPEQILVKAAFLFGLTAVNIFGVKAAGRVNDILTILKLLPLLLLVIVGLASIAYNPAFFTNYNPTAPLGLGNFGTALVLIFWAYVGFELGTLPAAEVKDPKKNIPRAIMTGMAIVIFFYLTTNFVIFGTVSSPRLAQTVTPLVLVGAALLGTAGAVVISERSRNPPRAMLSVRGIGVAVRVRTCTLARSACSRSLSRTPKRCSSSTTMSPSCEKPTSALSNRWVPITMSVFPAFRSAITASCSLVVWKRLRVSIFTGKSASRSPKVRECWSARIVVGTSTTTCLLD